MALLDEEDEIAEDEHDQPDAAVLGSVDEPPDRRHGENTKLKVFMFRK